MKQTEVAWCAGFFDGEGCIHNNRAKNGYGWMIKVTQKDPEALLRFQNTFRGGTIAHTNILTAKGTPTYINNYCLYGQDAAIALNIMLPYLTVKREKALIMIQEQSFVRPKAPIGSLKNRQRRKPSISNRERLSEIIRMHDTGLSFTTIGVHFNVTRQRAHQLYLLAKHYMVTSIAPSLLP